MISTTEETALATVPSDLASEPQTHLAWANALIVSTHEQLAESTAKLQGIKALAKKISDWFAPMKTRAWEAHKQIVAKEKELLDPLANAERAAKQAMLTFTKDEETKRQAEQARLQAIADEQARRERERLEKQAAKLKTPEKKAAIMEQAAMVTAPVVNVAKAAPVAGTQTRKVWKMEITDPKLLPREWLVPDIKALEAYAKSMKERSVVPGVRFYTEEQLAIRS